jgi:hypothetical protein
MANCHTKGGGASRKGDADTIVAGCKALHDEMHRGQPSCAARLGLDFATLAAQTEAAWRAHCDGGWLNAPEFWGGHQ